MQRRFHERLRDPRFQRLPKKLRKVSTDRRFRSISSKFLERSQPDVDKFGRPIDRNKKLSEQQELESYYQVLSDPSSSEEESNAVTETPEKWASEVSKSEMVSIEHSSNQEATSASSVVPLGRETHRLAVTNLDWKRLYAVDILAALNSFCPESGQILSICVYPTEYGKYWLNKESQEGPQLERFRKKALETLNDNSAYTTNILNLEQEEFDEQLSSEIARQYELDREKFYVGVVVCDSVATASSIYEQCDGLELESSGNVFDLRFIPDDVVFQDLPRDSAGQVPNNYEPKTFSTLPLQHTFAKLSWDEDDPHRAKLKKRRFTEQDLLDDDLRTYLASSDSEIEEEKRDVYKQLASEVLSSGKDRHVEKEENLEMEATFISGLDNIGKKILQSKEQKEVEMNESAWERRLRKMKSKKNAASKDDKSSIRKEAELELLFMNSKETNDYSSDEGKQRKSKLKKVKSNPENFSLDTEDPRFAALYHSHDFALDPTDSRFKKSSGMKKLLHERSKRLYDTS
ncbi:Pre-rRNA-processing protein esf1 [Galdieria sulphuraria]|nr:Pre-rRNA-processing protein esf1 [Galdieria sulphuraria]